MKSIRQYCGVSIATMLAVLAVLGGCSQNDSGADRQKLSGTAGDKIAGPATPAMDPSQIFALLMNAGSHDRAIELIRSGSVTRLRDSDANTPLHITARMDHEKLTEELLKLPGIELNPTNKANKTPVMLAAENGYIESVKQLIGAGADPRLATPEGSSAITLAAEAGNTPIVDYLKTLGIDDSEVKKIVEKKRQNEVRRKKMIAGLYRSEDKFDGSTSYFARNPLASFGSRVIFSFSVQNGSVGPLYLGVWYIGDSWIFWDTARLKIDSKEPIALPWKNTNRTVANRGFVMETLNKEIDAAELAILLGTVDAKKVTLRLSGEKGSRDIELTQQARNDMANVWEAWTAMGGRP